MTTEVPDELARDSGRLGSGQSGPPAPFAMITSVSSEFTAAPSTHVLRLLIVGDPASARVRRVLKATASVRARTNVLAVPPKVWPSRLDAVLLAIDTMTDWMTCCRIAAVTRAPVIVVSDFLAADRRYRDLAFAAGAAAYVCGSASAADWSALLARVRAGERGIEILRQGCSEVSPPE